METRQQFLATEIKKKGTSNVRSYVVICPDEQHFRCVLCLYPRCDNHFCGRKLKEDQGFVFYPSAIQSKLGLM